ncbi:unnamed protein product [Gongylonema pulchrum]|uniref:Transmembrane protein n=1 Tax=Gongylonema pulchrum TaxID=637853 RepID=A0A183EEC4_9BILA|nr:unnamed protein product [Gongylonema pulchrum]
MMGVIVIDDNGDNDIDNDDGGEILIYSRQVVVGWGVARFGLFGTRPQPVYNNFMNVAGLFLVLVSGIMFVFVKHENQQQQQQQQQVLDSDAGNNGSASKQGMQIEENAAANHEQNNAENEMAFRISKAKIG